MDNIDFYDVDYCKYGFRYRKGTRIWTNLKGWEPKPLCKKMWKRGRWETSRDAQRLPCGKKADWGENYIVKQQTDLYRMPQQLIEEIFQQVGLNL